MIRDPCSLIFVSLENWDDIWRRNQFICADLAQRFPDMRILFVAPPRDVSNAIRTRRMKFLSALNGPNHWHPDGFPNITVTRPLKLLPSTLAIGRWINNFMTRHHIRRAMKKLEVISEKLETCNAGVPPATEHLATSISHLENVARPPSAGNNKQNESAAFPSHAKCEMPDDHCPASAALPDSNSCLLTPGSSMPRGAVLWLNPQDAVHMAGRMGESKVIYDITDDWTQFTHFTDRKKLLQRTIAEDAELCRKADVVIVCSQSLYKSRKALSKNLHLIPNGVNAAHYRCVLDDRGPLPEACRNWQHPVFGYTGSIHPDRVDVDFVDAMASAMKAQNLPGTIVLVGPDMLSADQRRRLEATNRVIFTGPVAYRDLPQYMRAFDVCIVPHCMTAFVESLNPIKLWEYLAAGKPIVSTDVAGFRDYSDLVRIARTPANFLHECQLALVENPEKCDLRRAEAAQHSWHSRVDQIVAVLTQ